MNRITLTLVILLGSVIARAQQDEFGFPYGKVTYADFEAKFPADTSAEAVVIKELAEAHVDYETNDKVIYTYHTKIKILKQSGSKLADVFIDLAKSSSSKDEMGFVQASAFNLVNNKIEETKMDSKTVFVERNGRKRYDEAKFAIPNVKAGTVIEYRYVIILPIWREFKKWEFQSTIPKLYSEYWTVIPGNFHFNITLRGYLNLTERIDKVNDNCVAGPQGAFADCASTRYIMKNVPAFKEEEYMLAKGNYLSSINFELSDVEGWDGKTRKYTTEWKDADEQLKQHDNFGLQLRRGRNAFDGLMDESILTETDRLKKAKKIYDLVKFRMAWNEYYGAYADVGIKKAVDDKKGNVADINLSLVAALRQADYDADPVMLATRWMERPIEIHPVLSDFNYVVARVSIGDKIYLLDAVDDFLPFGLISEDCYNGKGRVIDDEGSYWMELKPTDRNRIVTQTNLKITPEGNLTGTITHSYFGYAGVDQRKRILKHNDEKTYLEEVKSNNHNMEITKFERTMDDDLSKAISETFSVEIAAFDTPQTSHFLFNPFFKGKLETNPFKTETRTYPVDFGVPLERSLIVNVEYPENVEVTSMPEKVGLALPNSGGRYLYSAQATGNKLSISNLMSIAKPVYLADEYPFLRELYARRIQTENADIIFQKKK